MLDRVRQRQRRTPGAAENEPAVNPVQPPQRLDVIDQVLRSDRGQVYAWLTRQRTTAPTAPLVKQGHAVTAGIEVSAPPRLRTRTWTAVEHNCWLSIRVPDTLPPDPVTATSFKDSRVEGLNDRIPHRVIMAEADQRRTSESLDWDCCTSVCQGVCQRPT